MNAVGIIAEYNPLHNGHIYHMNEARKLAGSDAVVVAMSGNYVQRGEPAILDKWERTRLALLNGADLVIEIPTVYCLGNAAQYAMGGVNILGALSCVSHIAFGSESGNIDNLIQASINLESAGSKLEDGIADYLKSGLSYPAARAAVYQKLFPDTASLPEESNDILALEYLRVCRKLESEGIRLDCIAVKRRGAAYNDCSNDDIFMSAGGIRTACKHAIPIEEYVPIETAVSLQEGIVTYPDDWVGTLKYAVLSASSEQIDNCPSGDKGLGNRIKSLITDASNWNELVGAVKTKRYTYTRISRLFMQIILGIDRENYLNERPGYVRILGMTDRGRELIAEMRNSESCTLPIVTNVSKQLSALGEVAMKQIEMDIHAADVYNLVTGRNQSYCSDYRMKPVIISL